MAVHGFTGTPWDVLPVAEGLAADGWSVRVPLLTGHDRGWRGIARARLSDWRRDVEEAARDVHERTGGPVLVVGLSMGALLCLDLAQRGAVPVRAVGSLAAPLRLGRPARALSALSRMGSPGWGERLIWPKIGGPDIANRRPMPGASWMPLRGVAELGDLVRDVRADLAAVRAPLLVVHARRDHTAPPEGASLLAASVSSDWVRLVLLEEGYHVITRDVCEERVAAEVVAFAARAGGRGREEAATASG
ncbi:MAG: alpha/beta hydrolase [Myxococcota bacterium]